MNNVLNIMATLFVSLAASCADQATPTVPNVTVIDQTVLDSATVLVIDSTERRFDYMPGANQMLVYRPGQPPAPSGRLHPAWLRR